MVVALLTSLIYSKVPIQGTVVVQKAFFYLRRCFVSTPILQTLNASETGVGLIFSNGW